MKKFLIALLGIILFFSTLISCVSISDTDSSNDLSNDVPNTTTINFFENTTTPDTNSKDPEPTGLTYELKNLDGKYYMIFSGTPIKPWGCYSSSIEFDSFEDMISTLKSKSISQESLALLYYQSKSNEQNIRQLELIDMTTEIYPHIKGSGQIFNSDIIPKDIRSSNSFSCNLTTSYYFIWSIEEINTPTTGYGFSVYSKESFDSSLKRNFTDWRENRSEYDYIVFEENGKLNGSERLRFKNDNMIIHIDRFSCSNNGINYYVLIDETYKLADRASNYSYSAYARVLIDDNGSYYCYTMGYDIPKSYVTPQNADKLVPSNKSCLLYANDVIGLSCKKVSHDITALFE